MLTRKDYRAIAAILSAPQFENQPQEGYWHWAKQQILGALVGYMVADNPRFDRDKFVAACYGE